MIILRGHQKPTKEQAQQACAHADDSFSMPSHQDFLLAGPTYENYVPNALPILLKLKHVHPHQDDWIGDGDAPPEKQRRAIFWLIKGELHIQAGNDFAVMRAGDFIVFNDTMAHSVIATKTWVGAAWQLLKNNQKVKK